VLRDAGDVHPHRPTSCERRRRCPRTRRNGERSVSPSWDGAGAPGRIVLPARRCKGGLNSS
jgi:hypothetical protein